MKTVDDSLVGVVPARGGKAGGKGAHHAETAAQKDAFNRAFSEAGKKQQPQISIRDKAGSDASEISGRISIQSIDTTKTDPARPNEANPASAKQQVASQVPFEESLPALPEVAPETEASAATAKPKQPTQQAHANGPFERLSAVLEKLAQTSDEDETPIANTDIASKLADVFKGRKSELSEKLQGKDQTSPAAEQDNAAGAGSEATTGGVDQLLTLLQASQAAADQGDMPQATSGLSEFQALADRAVKPKTDGAKAAPSAKGSEAAHAEANLSHNVEGSETDQVFRFARADGKGQPVSMKVGNDGGKTTVDAENTPAAKAETVTVVEARRYLGMAPVSSNAQAVTSAISGSSEWAQSVQQASAADTSFQQATGKVVNTLKIQMHPIDLGMVTATLRLKDDELHVDLKVETGDAFRQLSDDQNAMVKALRAQGFSVDQVNIVFNAPDSNSSSSQQQQQFAPGGQNGREAQAGNGEGRGQRQDGGNQQGERWTANDTTGDGSSSDAGRAGDVYM
ncbi:MULTISPECIES: flagellar hook-length control protein FliK [unclassified Rhizobium]|uniref:flagellar hook-length control protein FliK n=1 Tax=unclassified Rhizobium TaxID=2613769 RepID=UPI0006FF0753|nr:MULTISPECIES: flagellar hook-length control protein FliK [unclassified Rhizobium]KQV43882.1 hypothetical protein ASC86_03550 [Rhizobium sp. Root1212]